MRFLEPFRASLRPFGLCSLGGLIKALKGLVEALESLVMAFRIRALRAL